MTILFIGTSFTPKSVTTSDQRPKDNHLVDRCMFSALIAVVVVLPIFLLTFNTKQEADGLAWITLIISIEAGVVITLIVDDRSKKSHQEVVNSQTEISKILEKLKETDLKHNEVLSALQKSQESNEKLAINSIVSSLEYITEMLKKLTDTINPSNFQRDDKKLISDVLKHLESPLNLIVQAVPQTGTRIKNEQTKLITQVIILRKLVITSLVVSNDNMLRIFNALKTGNDELTKNLESIKAKSN